MSENLRHIILYTMLLIIPISAMAHVGPGVKRDARKDKASVRAECRSAEAQIDMEINNVRARLLSGGDVWWDLANTGKYIVPKTLPGQQEVSSIFAGAVWIGGLDPAGNLKIAAVDFRRDGNTDYFTGPIDPVTGSTDSEVCEAWDRFFRVLATNVESHNNRWDRANAMDEEIDCDSIPDDVKFWPGKGNPFFLAKFEFELPNTGQGLGSFWDEDDDGNYNPCNGDFPIIDIRGCAPANRSEAKELVPDEMTFWIYNDAGGPHTLTQGNPILMEVQVQAFAFSANDEINDMTFQRYKLINRASSDIRDCYFAMWMDPDLGCNSDDYIGCDIDRSLAYVYNEDVLDGEDGCTCNQGIGTYCDEIPMLGVDYFRGPLAPKNFDENGLPTLDPPIGSLGDTLVELGMSSFIYYNASFVGSPDPSTTDPTIDTEYYNYLRGLWRDGSAITFGDDGFNPGSTDTVRYTFPNPPNQTNGWSMCEEDLPFGDRRFIQASGPFLLKPQAINELIIGVTWVPDFDYPCPDISRLLFADDLAQALFDNCFQIKDGPDSPDVDVVELDKELVLILTNDTITSNNKFEAYTEKDLNPVPEGLDSNYVFEGYQIFQLSGPNVSSQELDDITKARIVRQVDVRNDVTTLYNWRPSLVDPTPNNTEIVWTFEEKVAAQNEGVKHTFLITEDDFAEGDRRLINHKEYYFMVLAYAHNNWQDFDPSDGFGQRSTYCAGRKNIKVITAVPRPIVFKNLNAEVGDGARITRLSGVGAGGAFLDMTDDMYDLILEGATDGRITYKDGQGPLDISIFNPIEVKDGRFRLEFVGDFIGGSTCAIAPGASWVLTNLANNEVVATGPSIDVINDQIVGDFGFTITVGQTEETGMLTSTNGVIGSRLEYQDPAGTAWLNLIPDAQNTAYNYLQTGSDEVDKPLDPEESFSSIGPGAFAPFILMDNQLGSGLVSAAWKDFGGGEDLRDKTTLADLNNVDIVFTSDKSKWSRCVIVETSTAEFRQAGFVNEGDVNQFDLRDAPSVGKDDNDGDGRPDADGDGRGMGWFPGYAVDVETGQRLNIFFGENSTYNEDLREFYGEETALGTDMMFNPSSTLFTEGVPGADFSIWNFITGGQHFIYVTRQNYDECADFRERLDSRFVFTFKRDPLKLVTWAGIPTLANGSQLLSYADGLIPNDVIVKLRVENPYSKEEAFDLRSETFNCDDLGELPAYEFEISGKEAQDIDASEVESALKNVNVAPNPYYAFSEYETSRLENQVKITNLPERANVTIYTLDGKFIRQFRRDERGAIQGTNRSNPGIRSTQPNPDIVWDLKNNKGIPVASGVYLIHVEAPELGAERTIKWFGVNRKFDPAGL